MRSRSIVFVHGMYMTPLCWEGWLPFFRERGFEASAPAWPGRDAPVDELRKKHPDPALGRLGLRDVVEELSARLEAMPEKPVLVGHSMGGLIVQLLLQRGLAAAAVAIDSAPPQGVFSARWSFLKANWGHANPFVPVGRPVVMSFRRFRYAFVNGMPEDEQRAAFERYVVPESRRVPFQSLTSAGRVDFSRPGAPLLLIAGGSDNIIPASLNRTNHRRYRRRGSVTSYVEMPGRNHFVIGQRGWEEVASRVASWLDEAGV